MQVYDLVIVGGGIGGSALGCVMARDGYKVLILERTTEYPDRVRGEWIAPWGVVEVQRLGLYDTLVAAGGHTITRHITYDEAWSPEEAEAQPLPLGMFHESVAGPLAIGHPHHCQTLADAAVAAGATLLRGVGAIDCTLGSDPTVTYSHGGAEHVAKARLVVGADGRTSHVRRQAGIVLHEDKPHHWFAGLLVENVKDWPADLQAIGTEGDFAFLVFPQGDGRARIYGSYPLEQTGRYSAANGAQAFLDRFRAKCCPNLERFAEATPAGPVMSYSNHDTWTEQPYGEGVVLVGDAAGWNDPIVGQGLSITYRDVRIVSEALKAAKEWTPAIFAEYGSERMERLRRLRFAAGLTSTFDAEFGEDAKARRRAFHERKLADPSLGVAALAVMAGPELVPAEVFTPENRARIVGESMDQAA
ncbi:FAD-dependent oxidoreductase [Zavarzinia sp. CC-PAN008]|uniref:FAD-dependent oxidoreductase n=1 Tax=Zavarzinia sp. CC-PAN008 TaxID=3243332 RepID=UPI003F743653